MLGGIAGLDGQLLLPILPIAIHELNGDGRTDGLTMAHAGEDVSLVGLDLHAAAAAIALLAAPKLAIDKIEVDWNACRNPGNQRNESLAMGFTGCGEADHTDSIVNARRRGTTFSGSRAVLRAGAAIHRRLDGRIWRRTSTPSPFPLTARKADSSVRSSPR